MKLLLVNALYPPHAIGGAERSVALLAEALARDGADVHVATLAEGGDETATVERGVTVHRLPIDQHYWPWSGASRTSAAKLRWHLRNRWNRAAAARFGWLLDRIRPDLVHGHVLTGFSPSVWLEAKRRGLPLAQSLRDYALICPRAALFRGGTPCVTRCPDCRLLTRPTRDASRLVDGVAGNSDFTLDMHRRAGRFEGVGGGRLFNVVPHPAGTRREPATGPLRFGFLGRIEAEKGIGVLLAALPHVGRDAWILRIGGSGREADLRRYRARSDRRVEWLGHVDAGAFYRSIDVLIVPSLWPEPLPRTLVEAVAHGCSIIAASSGGIPEVAGIAACAMLYRADDPEALAAAMRGAIDQPGRWRARDATPGAALRSFGEAAVVAAHHNFYDAVRKAAR